MFLWSRHGSPAMDDSARDRDLAIDADRMLLVAPESDHKGVPLDRNLSTAAALRSELCSREHRLRAETVAKAAQKPSSARRVVWWTPLGSRPRRTPLLSAERTRDQPAGRHHHEDPRRPARPPMIRSPDAATPDAVAGPVHRARPQSAPFLPGATPTCTKAHSSTSAIGTRPIALGLRHRL